MAVRSVPSTVHAVVYASETTRTRSPGSAFVRSSRRTASSSDRWRASGPSSPGPGPAPPLSTTRNQASPAAPAFLACAVSSSSLERGRTAPSCTTIAFVAGDEKALTSVRSKTGVRSTSSMPKRRSGLSVPKRSSASAHVMRSIGGGRSPVAASAASSTTSATKPITSSWLAKEHSMSSCVNSNCRSARRSSSRRQRAIW